MSGGIVRKHRAATDEPWFYRAGGGPARSGREGWPESIAARRPGHFPTDAGPPIVTGRCIRACSRLWRSAMTRRSVSACARVSPKASAIAAAPGAVACRRPHSVAHRASLASGARGGQGQTSQGGRPDRQSARQSGWRRPQERLPVGYLVGPDSVQAMLRFPHGRRSL